LRRVIVALCTVALLVTVFAPATLAKSIPKSLITGEIAMATYFGPPPATVPYCPVVSKQDVLDETGCWYGTVTGDITGTIAFWEDPAGIVVDSTLHFFEKFTFWPDQGKGWVIGYDEGWYDLVTGAFTASGEVTGSSGGKWAALVGRSFYEVGTTTDPSGYPITGNGVQFLIAVPED
jgi:hypothetical protein